MFRTALDSFCLLRKEVGLVQAISIAWELQCHLRRGEPWQSLFPVIDSREQASRDQAGPAILLYTILRSRIGKDRALEITKTIIQIGALHFLKKIVPTFNKKSYQSLSADEQ